MAQKTKALKPVIGGWWPTMATTWVDPYPWPGLMQRHWMLVMYEHYGPDG